MLDEFIIKEESVSSDGRKVTITGTSYGQQFSITLCTSSLEQLQKRINYLQKYMRKVQDIAKELEQDSKINLM